MSWNPVAGIGAESNIMQNALVNAGSSPVVSRIQDVSACRIISLQLIIRSFTGGFTGNWLVEASNNWTPQMGDAAYGQASNNTGDWTDITATFANQTITAAITANGSMLAHSSPSQCGYRALRVTITRTGGTSVIGDVWVVGKR